MKLTPEERERRSQRAKELNAQGKFGGPQPGSGRPRKKRASELVAEEAEKHSTEIVAAFLRGVRDGDAKTAVMAAEKWLGVENKEATLQLQEQKQLDSMSREDLIVMLAEGFSKLKKHGVD